MPFQGFFGVIHHALQSSFCVVHHAVQGAFGVIHGKPLEYKNCAHHGYEQVEMEKRDVPEDETVEARDEVEIDVQYFRQCTASSNAKLLRYMC